MSHLYPIETEVIAFGTCRSRIVEHITAPDDRISMLDQPFAAIGVAFYLLSNVPGLAFYEGTPEVVMEFQIKPVSPLVLLAECAEGDRTT